MAGTANAAAPPLSVARLALRDFRNYADIDLALDPVPVVVTGENGAGKTNLLEALSLLTPGRGLRRARLSQMLSDRAAPTGTWSVLAELRTPDGRRSIACGMDPAGREEGREARLVRVDGSRLRVQEQLLEMLAVQWLVPAMDTLFRGSAGDRRRFLDRCVFAFQPDHARQLRRFETALRERTAVLRSPRRDPLWLTTLERQMAASAVAVCAARAEVAARLSAAAETTPEETAFPVPALSVDGVLEGWLRQYSALAVEDRYAAELEASRARDAEAGGAAVGPHRSDLAVRYLPRGIAAAEASTGEQKALLVGLVLAQAQLLALERGQPPLLLLDDVAAFLDARRRAALFERLLAMRLPCWLTGTDDAPFAALQGRAQVLHVAGGRAVQ